MPAPLAKGIIIAASVLVAAGIAIYESPQVRQWLDESRRKIAIALHTLGDEIQPRRASESSEQFEARRREIVRQRRNELVRRAREEGIAVDLDELARVGIDDLGMDERNRMERSRTNASQRSGSFDDMVGRDGKLMDEEAQAGKATGADMTEGSARRRGVAGFDAGVAAAGDPFSDDTHILFDRDNESRHSSRSATIEGDLIDFTTPTSNSQHTTLQCPQGVDPEWFAALPMELQQEIMAAHASEQTPEHTKEQQPAPLSPSTVSWAGSGLATDDQAAQSQSFHSLSSSHSDHTSLQNSTQYFHDLNDDIADMALSTGTLTPRSSSGRSDRSAVTGASVVGSQADDIAVMSEQGDADHDAHSETWSEAGFTDAGTDTHSEGGYSGIMTPNSWTDVGSDDEGSV